MVQLPFMEMAVDMQAQTSATVHVVDKDEFTAVGFGLGKWWKFPRLRSEGGIVCRVPDSK